jgi:ATP-dependent DNA helicase DinG
VLGPARPTATGEGTALLALVGEAGEELFDRLSRLAPASSEGRVPLARDAWQGELLAAYHRLDETLEALSGYADANAVNEAVRLVAGRAGQLRDDLGRIVDPATNQITWVEVRGRSVVVGASPVDLGRVFREQILDRVGAVVLTSATLTTGSSGDFRFLRSRLGIEGRDRDVEELTVPSPFAFESSALLYTPSDLPDVADGAFVGRAAERIAELVAASRGGAFVLCTSVRSMRALAALLRGRTPETPLVQGDAPKSALVARFRASNRAVLFATMSFWEGVDVPGDALRLVVIDKIPFAVPTDPVVVARQAAIEAQGGNAFARYALPQAAITLKQGFGRLLRTRADRGVVAILDRRVRTRSYGASLLGSLPPAPRTDRLDDVRAFFERTSQPALALS